jgi:acyl-CoA reductase-like NAD-dependent aldehyde dehydrogenase
MYPSLINHWIDDADASASSGESFPKRSPIDDRVVSQVTRGNAADVTRAVDSAERASEAWGRMTAPKRGEVLGRAGALLRAREREFAEIIRCETGKPQVPQPKGFIRRSARSWRAKEPPLRQDDDDADREPAVWTVRTPIGVRAAIMLSTARWPASPGKYFRRSCAATLSWPSRTSSALHGDCLRERDEGRGPADGCFLAVQGTGADVAAR